MDWIDKIPWWVGWAGVACAVTASVVSFSALRGDRKKPIERIAKDVVIALGLVGAMAAAASTLKGGRLQHAVGKLFDKVIAQDKQLSNVTRELSNADEVLTRQNAALQQASNNIRAAQNRIATVDANSIALAASARAQLRVQADALLEANRSIRKARQQIAATQASVASIETDTRAAKAASEEAKTRTQSVMRLAVRTQRETDEKLQVERALVTQAAIKAGVYHVPDATLTQLSLLLKDFGPGTAAVSCSPGLENACDDLDHAIASAGWRVGIHKAAPFFTGGGLDAPADPMPTSGLILSYRAPFAELAERVGHALTEGNLRPYLWLVPDSPVETDLGFLLRFISK